MSTELDQARAALVILGNHVRAENIKAAAHTTADALGAMLFALERMEKRLDELERKKSKKS